VLVSGLEHLCSKQVPLVFSLDSHPRCVLSAIRMSNPDAASEASLCMMSLPASSDMQHRLDSRRLAVDISERHLAELPHQRARHEPLAR